MLLITYRVNKQIRTRMKTEVEIQMGKILEIYFAFFLNKNHRIYECFASFRIFTFC